MHFLYFILYFLLSTLLVDFFIVSLSTQSYPQINIVLSTTSGLIRDYSAQSYALTGRVMQTGWKHTLNCSQDQNIATMRPHQKPKTYMGTTALRDDSQWVEILKLTCTLGPAHKRWSRRASSSLSRPSQQHTDVVFCVWIQVPQLICHHVYSMNLWPWRLAGTVLNLLPDNGAISQDRVGVELDDQVSGAGA